MIERKNAKCMIEVDGGVTGLNVAELDEAGVDIVVAAAMILTLIAWLVGWLRLRFARKHDLSTPIAPLTWLGRVARICGALSALAVVG